MFISQKTRKLTQIAAVLISSLILISCPDLDIPEAVSVDVSFNLSGSDGYFSQASFSAETSSISLNAPSGLESIDIELESDPEGLSIKINDEELIAGSAVTVPISDGTNVITIEVTPTGGDAVKYTLNITKAAPSDDADLSDLELSIGTLSPSFSADVFVYTASVSTATNAVTVTPSLNDEDAAVTVDGTTVASGASSDSLSLEVGANEISVVVTAEDGKATRTYTITITRLAETDSEPPVITLIGDENMTVASGSSFTDPGANVSDNLDGSWVIYSEDEVDTSVVGDYALRYNASDSDGNDAVEVIRTVTVEAAADPIELAEYFYWNPDEEDYIHFKLGDGIYTINSQTDGQIDSGSIYSYSNDEKRAVLYSTSNDWYLRIVWSDFSSGSFTNTLYGVFDTAAEAASGTYGEAQFEAYTSPEYVPPMLVLNGDASVTIEQGEAWTDPGAVAYDWGSDPETVIPDGEDLDGLDKDNPSAGSYTITYYFEDDDLNSDTLERQVDVIIPATNDWGFTGGYTLDGTIDFSALSSRDDVQFLGIFVQGMEGPEYLAHSIPQSVFTGYEADYSIINLEPGAQYSVIIYAVGPSNETLSYNTSVLQSDESLIRDYSLRAANDWGYSGGNELNGTIDFSGMLAPSAVEEITVHLQPEDDAMVYINYPLSSDDFDGYSVDYSFINLEPGVEYEVSAMIFDDQNYAYWRDSETFVSSGTQTEDLYIFDPNDLRHDGGGDLSGSIDISRLSFADDANYIVIQLTGKTNGDLLRHTLRPPFAGSTVDYEVLNFDPDDEYNLLVYTDDDAGNHASVSKFDLSIPVSGLELDLEIMDPDNWGATGGTLSGEIDFSGVSFAADVNYVYIIMSYTENGEYFSRTLTFYTDDFSGQSVSYSFHNTDPARTDYELSVGVWDNENMDSASASASSIQIPSGGLTYNFTVTE